MSGRRRQSATAKPAPAAAGGQDSKKRMRSESEVLPSSGGAEKKSSSSSSPATVRDLTVDERVLDCGVCFLPLKPPIFQCGVGHVLCSSCSKKLKNAGKCHLCGVALPGGVYQRCHAMDDMLNSIRGPCPHARYGCDTTPVYHAREEHLRQCPHAPCHCPGDGCAFVGSVTTLVEHLTAAAAHSWPCTAEARAGRAFDVSLRDGFNFVTAVRGSANAKHLLLLNMVTTPFGRAVSMACIRSVAAMASSSSSSSTPMATTTRNLTWDLDVNFSQHKDVPRPSGHFYTSRFQVERPFSGMPDLNASFQFFVPKYVVGSDEAAVQISATIVSISSS